MDVSRIRALRGPNLWSRHTAIQAIVSCNGDEVAIANLPGFETRLRERFPELGDLIPSDHLDTVSMAHALEFCALGLQAQAGCPVTFSRTTQTVEAGIYQVVVEYSEEDVGRLAFEYAEKLCLAALNDTPFDLDGTLKELRDLDEDIRLGPSTGAIVAAAQARGIPFRRLTQGSLVQFGWGSKQKRIQAAETSFTSAIAESIAQDKELTKKLLHASGVAVPYGRPVDDEDDAWVAAQEVGLPVVVKPQDGNQGKGISVNLTTEEQVRKAYRVAIEFRDDIMVEKYLPGHDWRLLVIGDKLIAAARRDPPLVIGDGTHTVRQLVDIVNSDPRRSDGHATSLTKIRFDDIAVARLAQQGFTADTVPGRGVRVILRNNANLSTGGTATDVTDDVHPDLAAAAVAAAQTVGLDIAGIDVVCDTILKPLEDQGGGIVEVNAAPGLRMHLDPSFGKGRAVGEAIVGMMFPNGPNGKPENARIPVVAIAGTNGKTTTSRLIGRIFEANGQRVGMTSTDGVYIEGRQIDNGDCSGPRSARNVLMHPDVDAAVFETARGGVLREGLGFDMCDVAVVTNIGIGDHLGLNYITTVDELAVVKRVIVENVSPKGMAVLNAADPQVTRMAAHCPGNVTFFARDKANPVLATHRAQNKRVVYANDEGIVCQEGRKSYRIPFSAIPLTRNGSIGFQVENAMAATATGWALGLDWAVIEKALAGFVSDAATAPGRFNVFDYKGATLIADYGHNPDAMQALVQAVEGMKSVRRSVVISGAGDRRDDDIRQQTEILGQAFDDAILYQDACQRGREDGEVVALLRDGLKHAKRTKRIDQITGEFKAIDLALERLQPGDLCLILIDQVEEALAHITRRIAEAA
ncbi:cyanophycin synthetase [Dechloromonas sp. XY25]|uniref:Cyanophycin synthetase n=1 Tax=Dechloromonas hankyongensis TaxID=2908002 RepID=A0ABS9K718_9RHOO|nr:cyanophycin synthetase [Dechloromonas hankyongensis]MCG2578946.1 cyanophycin synthetase [Dechloromonas hankyongensis]